MLPPDFVMPPDDPPIAPLRGPSPGEALVAEFSRFAAVAGILDVSMAQMRRVFWTGRVVTLFPGHVTRWMVANGWTAYADVAGRRRFRRG